MFLIPTITKTCLIPKIFKQNTHSWISFVVKRKQAWIIQIQQGERHDLNSMKETESTAGKSLLVCKLDNHKRHTSEQIVKRKGMTHRYLTNWSKAS